MSTRGLELDLSGRKTAARPVLKRIVQRFAPTLLYRRPVSVLQPERLYAYLDAIWRRRELDGAIVEVGSYLGGTAVIAYHMLQNIGHPKRYICVDTFGGFISDHFVQDTELGTPTRLREEFAENSINMVRSLMRYYECEAIELVKADIVQLPPALLPDSIAISLIDVDLEVPVYAALEKTFPRIVDGGVILVDDCGETSDYAGARLGYSKFMQEHNMPENYFLGFGVVTRT